MSPSVDFQGLSLADLARKTIADSAGEHPPSFPVVDACVHPRPRPEELRPYLPKVWQGRRLPAGDRYYYPNPLGDSLKDAFSEAGPPGSDPALTSRHLFEEMRIDRAVLTPLTLGLLPDGDLLAAICTATNEWLAETWLGQHNAHGKFYGTIRVTPTRPAAAVAEIEKWADHPGFVQIGIPLQSLQLYGTPPFLPIWEAAAHHKLPVFIHADAETGVELAPTPAGYLRHFLAFAAYQPINFINHLTSFMVGGVLDALPDLRLVFGDGGYDLAVPLMWRVDKDYRPMRGDVPWMKRLPSDYIAQHVRFIAHRMEGPTDDGMLDEWLEMGDAKSTLMYASNYPSWDFLHPSAAFGQVEPEGRERIMARNALELYALSPSEEDGDVRTA
jgi:predicted TIM-barrel fold metal-dependent hydrolase